MKHLVGMIAVGALTAACATMESASSVTTPNSDPNLRTADTEGEQCPADNLKHLVGQLIGEIDVDSLPQPSRVVPHGVSVTMEYRAERTTLWLDPDARVQRVICG